MVYGLFNVIVDLQTLAPEHKRNSPVISLIGADTCMDKQGLQNCVLGHIIEN